MFISTVVMAMRGVTGSDMYDLLGSLSVFGFLTAYALVALALPFARAALGQHSHTVAVVSVITVVVTILIGVFDLRSSADPAHARIPYIYLAYIVAGLPCIFYVASRRGLTRGLVASWLRFRLRLHHDQQHKPTTANMRKAASCPFHMRLPHQEPLRAHGEKRHQPHQHGQRQRHHRHALGQVECRRRQAQRPQQPEPTPHHSRTMVAVSQAMIEM